MNKWRFNPGLAAIVVAVMCILSLIIGAGAIAMQALRPPFSVITVPGDYATIQAAVDSAGPGDVIQVGQGIYQGAITLNKPITLVAENYDAIYPVNNSTVLDGMGGEVLITVPPNMTQMPTLRGFVLMNALTAIHTQSPMVIESNYFSGTNFHVNYQDGSGGINRGNIYIQSMDDAIHVENASRPLLIENNRILYAGDDGIEIGFQLTPASAVTTGIDIWNNMIIGSHQDGVQIIDYGAALEGVERRVVLVGNLIANNQRAGLGMVLNTASAEDYSGADLKEPVRAYNNTFYGNDVALSGGDNLVVFNSIIANSLSRGAWKVQGDPGSNSVIAHTLFFNNVMDADQSVLGAGNILGVDPLFAAAPNAGADGTWGTVDDDFSGLLLSAASPAIDKGVVQYLTVSGEPVPPEPITGFTGAAPDLGWREYGSAAFVTATPTLLPTMTLQATNTPFVVSPIPSNTPFLMTATPGPTNTAAPTSTLQAPTVAPTQTTAPTATATPTFSITGLVPNSAQAGGTVNVTITGTGFVNGAVVLFEGGQGPAPQVTALQVLNPTTIVMTVNTAVDETFGAQIWDLRLTNSDLTSILLLEAFTVTPAP